jgi:hypothetical protein
MKIHISHSPLYSVGTDLIDKISKDNFTVGRINNITRNGEDRWVYVCDDEEHTYDEDNVCTLGEYRTETLKIILG